MEASRLQPPDPSPSPIVNLLSLPHHLLTDILHIAGTSGAAAACCCTSLLHAWAPVLSDPDHATALLLQRYGSVDEALKHLYTYAGASYRRAYLHDRLGRSRTALGALGGVLRTLSRLPDGPTAPALRYADGLPAGLPTALIGDKLRPAAVELPAAAQQQHHHHQQQQQQQRVTPGTEAGDLYAEAVVRGLVSRGDGRGISGAAGEAVGCGAATAGHERVVVFLLSQGVCSLSMMNGASLSGNVRLCTALLAALQPYTRIHMVGVRGLLQAGQGTAAAQQQAAAAVAGAGEGQAYREAEQKADTILKNIVKLCLQSVCLSALPAPWPTGGRGDSDGRTDRNSINGGGGSNADSRAGNVGSPVLAQEEGRRAAANVGYGYVQAGGGLNENGGPLAAADDGSRWRSSSGGSSGATNGGGGDRGSGSGGGDGGGGGGGNQAHGTGISSCVPSVDTIVSVVSAARAAADAAAIAMLSTALQSDTWRTPDVTDTPTAAAAAAALATQSRWGPWATAAAPAPPAAPAALDALGLCAPCATPGGSPRGPLSSGVSPASFPSQPSTYWPHGSPGASPTHTSHELDASSSSSSSSSSPHQPPAAAAAGAILATANYRYLTLARSLVHAWGADPQDALRKAVWAGSAPLVSELLRAGADPRGMRHWPVPLVQAVAVLGRWDIVDGMYGRGIGRTTLTCVVLKLVLGVVSWALDFDKRVRPTWLGIWVLGMAGRLGADRWAEAVVERVWAGLWHVLWWWL